MRILDIGCGEGRIISNNKFLKEGDIYVGLDRSYEFIKRVERQGRSNNNINFVVSDAELIPFKKDMFDEVCCFDLLEHLDDHIKCLNDIEFISKKDCKLLITVPHPILEKKLKKLDESYYSKDMHRRMFKKQELEKLLNEIGFQILKLKEERFFTALTLTYRFYKKFGYEKQLGKSIGGDKISFVLDFLAFLASASGEDIKNELKETNRSQILFYPLLFFKMVIIVLDKIMERIYPQRFYIEAEKI